MQKQAPSKLRDSFRPPAANFAKLGDPNVAHEGLRLLSDSFRRPREEKSGIVPSSSYPERLERFTSALVRGSH